MSAAVEACVSTCGCDNCECPSPKDCCFGFFRCLWCVTFPALMILVYVVGIAITAGATYLYLVPFTNIVAMTLFADFACPPTTGIWGACGQMDAVERWNFNASNVSIGFFVFLLIQVSVGLMLLGLYLQVFSRTLGRIKAFDWIDCWNTSCSCYDLVEQDPAQTSWHQRTPNQKVCDTDCFLCCCTPYRSGPCMAYSSMTLIVVSLIASLIVGGVWIGRAITVRVVPQCIPYAGTSIGWKGCVNVSSTRYLETVGTLEMTYIGGDDCKACAAVGFSIFVLPVLLLIAAIISLVVFIRRFREIYARVIRRRRERKEQELNQPMSDALAGIPDAPPTIVLSDTVYVSSKSPLTRSEPDAHVGPPSYNDIFEQSGPVFYPAPGATRLDI